MFTKSLEACEVSAEHHLGVETAASNLSKTADSCAAGHEVGTLPEAQPHALVSSVGKLGDVHEARRVDFRERMRNER